MDTIVKSYVMKWGAETAGVFREIFFTLVMRVSLRTSWQRWEIRRPIVPKLDIEKRIERHTTGYSSESIGTVTFVVPVVTERMDLTISIRGATICLSVIGAFCSMSTHHSSSEVGPVFRWRPLRATT